MIETVPGRFFACDECPICEDWERRIEIAEEIGDDPQFEYCWCPKIGYKFYYGWLCSDAIATEKPKRKQGKRKTGSAYRREMRVRKRDRLMEICDFGYHPYAGWVDWDMVDGVWQRTGKYVKFPKNSNKEKYLKNQTNRKIRRENKIYKGNQYRKCREYWWILY